MENAIARKLEPPILNPIEIEGILLNRLLSIGQKVFAEMRGVSESTISRRKSEGYYAEMAKEISALGLQVVPPEAVVVPATTCSQLRRLLISDYVQSGAVQVR